MRNIILLLTHSKDYYTIDHVQRAISDLGYRPFRFNTDEFPGIIEISMGLGCGSTTLSARDGEKTINILPDDIHAVWLRKIASAKIDENMDPLLRNGCIKESRETLDLFLNELNQAAVYWLDPIPVVRAAGNKLQQLKTAQKVGIYTPKTLITNDPGKVHDFYKQLQGNMIAKMLTPLTISMDGNSPFVFTNRLSADDLQDLESLRYSPMIFQECIESQYELRIAYVAGELFTGALFSPEALAGDVDWRAQRGKQACWKEFNVPEEFADKIRQFMRQMGLGFGAIDVIVQPDGRYVFLEVNPTGEWGMLERDLDLPISTSIARALINHKHG